MQESNIKQRILLVEESATLRYILGKLVQKQGYELLAVDCFPSAIDTLNNVKHNLHGVLVGWPNYEQNIDDSRELLMLLDRQPYSDLPVILLSNDAELEILNWMSTRRKSALVPWENYQEAVASMQTLLRPLPEPVDERRASPRPGKATRVLFVDDSKSLRTYYRRLLERNNVKAGRLLRCCARRTGTRPARPASRSAASGPRSRGTRGAGCRRPACTTPARRSRPRS